jgi:hypothetical protein
MKSNSSGQDRDVTVALVVMWIRFKRDSVRTQLTMTERSIGKFDGRVINFHVNFSLLSLLFLAVRRK